MNITKIHVTFKKFFSLISNIKIKINQKRK